MSDDFWHTPQFNDAFAAQHVGWVARAFRKHPIHASRYGREGISQDLLGSWIGLTQAQVSRIENGPPIRNLDTLAHWARVLRIPQNRLWFRFVDHHTPHPSRRRHLRPVLASNSAPIGADDAAMRAFRAANLRVGGGHLYASVTSYLATEIAPRLLATAEPGDVSVFTSAAALTEMAGWMAHDAGQNETAAGHFARASDLVRIGGDQQLSAHIMASRSHLAHHTHQPARALELASTGRRLLGRDERSPALAARLTAMAARSHAALRRHDMARNLLRQAESLLTRPTSEPPSPWISTFDEGALSGEAARCMRELNDPTEARRQAERVVALRGSERTRSWAFGQLMLASLLILDDQPDEAVRLATNVLEGTRSLGSYLVVRQLLDLGNQLHPYRSQRAVADFLDRLRDASRERLWLYRWIARLHPPATAGEELL
jgi:transcriptional regulator with XRE-family HTH domain